MSRRACSLAIGFMCVVVAIVETPADAATIHVPADYATIQEAIFAAGDGDIIVVADGAYTGPLNKNLDFGGLALTVRSENGPGTCVIDCEGDGRGFQFRFGEGPDSVVEGFTITGGSISQSGSGGGAIYLQAASSPTIHNCVMHANAVTWAGGAILCRDDSNPVITHCTISTNSANSYGGGIHCIDSSPVISDCTIIENSANYGAGIACVDPSDPLITNCTITANAASYAGGGLYCDDSSNPTLANCIVRGNTASQGGGFYCDWNCSPILVDCLITGNEAANNGGAIYNTRAHITAANCTFSGNSAGSDGGAAYCYSSSDMSITDCILWGDAAANGPELALYDSSDAAVSYSDVEGGWAWVYIAPNSTLIWGDGNLITDPLFLDPDGPDDDPGTWEDNDYHLASDSPCIDAGDPHFVPHCGERDIDGEPRVWDGNRDRVKRVDMGCDEANVPCVPGDLDGDGDVDLHDLAQLLGHYGTAPDAAYIDGDLDLDGDVDMCDLWNLLAVYGTLCE